MKEKRRFENGFSPRRDGRKYTEFMYNVRGLKF